MNVLVTGSTGFIGRGIVEKLSDSGCLVYAPVRNMPASSTINVHYSLCNSFERCNLPDVYDVLIHTAARAHVLNDTEASPLEQYLKTNRDATLTLAKKASVNGVKRFVFISTIKVYGERTASGTAFRAEDSPSPEDPYAISKHEAEQGLRKIAEETGMEVVIIRPPLVYGPGVKGNFANLLKALKRGLPLPLGAIHNKRSMVGIHNLVDLIMRTTWHPNAANKTFFSE
jgi:nucleoside-diphosphate-sugar epimerase